MHDSPNASKTRTLELEPRVLDDLLAGGGLARELAVIEVHAAYDERRIYVKSCGDNTESERGH